MKFSYNGLTWKRSLLFRDECSTFAQEHPTAFEGLWRWRGVGVVARKI
jgi:hypothetical protein